MWWNQENDELDIAGYLRDFEEWETTHEDPRSSAELNITETSLMVSPKLYLTSQ